MLAPTLQQHCTAAGSAQRRWPARLPRITRPARRRLAEALPRAAAYGHSTDRHARALACCASNAPRTHPPLQAKTHEKVDSIGEERSIGCHAVVMLIRKDMA